MMRSLFSGVSGLKNHQTRMDVIGNNIANVNTTGYKSSRVTFTDTLQQTLSGASAPMDNVGGTNPKQIGLGSAVGSIDMIMTDGSVQSTGKNTDLCLSGSGFFVVEGPGGTFYTRDGAFEFDKDGNYVLPGSGLFVQGWMAGEDGSINTSGDPGNIVVQAGKTMAATATKQATYNNNLDAGCAVITKITGGDPTTPGKATEEKPVTLEMSDGTKYTMTSGTYNIGESLPIVTVITAYDSLGKSHAIPVYFTKTQVDVDVDTDSEGNPIKGNIWRVSVSRDGAGDAEITEDDGTVTKVTLAPVELKFNSDGRFVAGSGQATLTLDNGATSGQKVQIDLAGLTQYTGSSTVASSTDGNEMGTLKSISIDSAGVITGTYTNGINKQEAQVALAKFSNPAGLTKTGSSLYQESNNSGSVTKLYTANDIGVTITPSALEMSNVDIANEFSDMIITQRGFQSNSKIITVSDEMLETLVNMKR